MFSAKSVRRNFCTLMKKLGLTDSKNSYKKFATVEGSRNIHGPRGYIVMYVGEELKRYQVPLKYLSLPKFQELIMQSQGDDLDVKVDGPITLACTTETFDKLLKLAKKCQTDGAV
ncbi:hypothetical protein Patl1_01011 [Pistacia atlantica]|uniref:Uncharacterized protein n=1 Tax=Pistacia atlantica TaxID=434234 RepID=A0ACC1CCZ4_9ROSI|nr:hypothetical protein Patl1_01011 [Pistacia atlantica]